MFQKVEETRPVFTNLDYYGDSWSNSQNSREKSWKFSAPEYLISLQGLFMLLIILGVSG